MRKLLPRACIRAAGAALLVLSVASCAHKTPPLSEGHIHAEPARAEAADIPQPAKTASFVPPPKPEIKPQTYSVVVNEVPVKELLLALARDTKQNIDVHPSLQGLVTLNAIDETLPAILDRVAKQVNLRYRTENGVIVVAPDTPHLKTYRVSYVNMTRNTTSSIGVSGQISGPAVGTTGSSGQADAANSSNTSVNTTSNNNFWELLEKNIRSILSATRALSQSAEDKAARAEAARAAREERMQQAEAVARAGAGAPTLFKEAFGLPATTQPGESGNEVVINPVAGSVSVLATEKQHALVQQYLDSVLASVQRQVLIEATIAEVRLSDAYQSGVDWSRILPTGGFKVVQQLGTFAAGTTPALALTYTNPIGNFTATLKLLEQFGNTRVLSSPKLMALNNQTALLKVVDNVVYFSIETNTTTAANTAAVTTYNTTAHTVPVGVVMSVTPQINENGQVALTVRPTISRILRFKNDPNPALSANTLTTTITNPVPEIQVREMESVLQINSGQAVILGGLMQDDTTKTRDQVPGLGNLPVIGDAFAYRNESNIKTELVIFLRPTVIPNPTLDSDELKFFQRYLPQIEGAKQP